jgi:Zn-dependent protease
MKCQYCGRSEDFPFRCSFCGMYFCGEHRLPENHNCPELWQATVRKPSQEGMSPQPAGEARPPQTAGPPSYQYRFRAQRVGWTSATEIVHLTAGALIVMAIGLSWGSSGLDWVFNILADPVFTFVSAALFTFIFLSHELAHKAVAKQFGLWAEFRVSAIGAAFTLMTLAVNLFKIVSPGAVNIRGAADKKTIGITALAGPLASISLACVLFASFFLVHGSPAVLLIRSASLAVWIAVFNLVPLEILDGAKVFWWNKGAWAVSIMVSFAVMILVSLYVV